MNEEYIKKLETENQKLYQERSSLYNLIKVVSGTNNLQIKFEHIVGIISPDSVVNYALKTYPTIKQINTSKEQWLTVDITGHHHTIMRHEKPYTDFDRELILKLFRVIWDDYNAKTSNKNSFGLLLDIIKDEFI